MSYTVKITELFYVTRINDKVGRYVAQIIDLKY